MHEDGNDLNYPEKVLFRNKQKHWNHNMWYMMIAFVDTGVGDYEICYSKKLSNLYLMEKQTMSIITGFQL